MSKPKAMKPAVSKDSWATPRAFFDYFDAIYNFTLDAAASAENTLVNSYYSEEHSGLKYAWHKSTWVNPPFSKKSEFIEKAIEQKHKGCTSVMLLPASTGAEWFQTAARNATQVIFIGGRIRFVGAPNFADFDVCLIVFSPSVDDITAVKFLPLPVEYRK